MTRPVDLSTILFLFSVFVSSRIANCSVLGLNCSSSANCAALGTFGSTCNPDGFCMCETGHRYHNSTDTCKAVYGTRCVNDIQCWTTLRCISGVCYCRDGYKYNIGLKLCQATFGRECSGNGLGCADLHTSCVKERDHRRVCRCSKGYVYATTAGVCKGRHGSSCANNAGCADDYNICQDGRCQCSFSYAYDSGKKRCAGLLGTECRSSDRCAVPNSGCYLTESSNRITVCACNHGYAAVAGKCRAEYGQDCTSSECLDPYSTCALDGVLICICQEGYRYSAGRCLPTYGMGCSSNITCADQHNICERGQCACANDYVYSDEEKVCKGRFGSTCLSEQECSDGLTCGSNSRCECKGGYVHTQGRCKAKHGYGCASTSDCVNKFSWCGSRSTCECVDGYVYIRIAKSCKALNRRACTEDGDCLDTNSQCDLVTKTCLCADGFLLSAGDNTCKADINSACSGDSSCYANNSKCGDNVCTCRRGFVFSRHFQCLAVYQGRCSSSDDCADPRAACVRELCACTTNHVYDISLQSCQAVVGVQCFSNDVCSSNAACVSDTCHCTAGYRNVEGLCKGAIGVSCNHSSHCIDDNECTDRECACRAGHHVDGDTCKAILGTFCTEYEGCYGSNIHCYLGRCQCLGNYEPSLMGSPRTCLAVFGQPCQSGSQCASNVCNIDRRCGCASGYKATALADGTHTCKALFGGRCQATQDCSDIHAACNSSRCTCELGYEYRIDSCQDVDDCEPEPCQNGGTCLNHIGKFECICPDLFAGITCQVSRDFCKKLAVTCQNGGTCLNKHVRFVCQCNRGFTGKFCHLVAPAELRDLVKLELQLLRESDDPVDIGGEDFRVKIATGMADVLDLAFCRLNKLRGECQYFVRRRRSEPQVFNRWTVQLDRARRRPHSVLVLFTARHNNVLVEPERVVTLCAALDRMEMVVKLGFTMLKRPSQLTGTVVDQEYCWIRSVFSDKTHFTAANHHWVTSLQSRLCVVMQTALNTTDNITVSVVDRSREGNGSLEVLYYTMLDNSCYSAAAISSLLNKLTADEFYAITQERPVLIAEPYNQSERNAQEQYQHAFVIVINRIPKIEMEKFGFWTVMEERLKAVVQYVLNTQDLTTCKLLNVERVNSTQSARLILCAMKRDVYVDPRHVVTQLLSADVDQLAIRLEKVVDDPLVAYVYTDNGTSTLATTEPSAIYNYSTSSGQASCGDNYQPPYNAHSRRYWIKTVTKVPIAQYADLNFPSSTTKRLTSLLVKSFNENSLSVNEENSPFYHLDHQRRSDPIDVCAKLVSLTRFNSSETTEIVYYVLRGGQPLRAIEVVRVLKAYELQDLAVALSQYILVKAQVYGQVHEQTSPAVSSGKEFLVVFLENYVERTRNESYRSLTVTVNACTNTSAKVTFETPYSDVLRGEQVVRAGQAATIRVPSNLMLSGTQRAYKTLRVTSDVDVVVTAYNHLYLSQDGYTVQPVRKLGHVYYVISYWPSSLHTQFAVGATQDFTKVIIKFSKRSLPVNFNRELVNGSSEVVLRQYEVLQVQNVGDLSGTKLTSDKPVAAYSGNVCTNVKGKSQDHLIDQLVPEQDLGSSFIVIMYNSLLNQSTIAKVVAVEDDSTVYYPYKDMDIRLESAGDYYMLERDTTDSHGRTEGHFLFASKPVMVATFSYSGDSPAGGRIGDPSMTLVPPMSSYQSRYRFTLPASAGTKHYISIAIEDAAYEELLLDNHELPTSMRWSTVPGTAPIMVVGSRQLLPGVHSLYHKNSLVSFYLHLYGAASHQSYGHTAGSCRHKFNFNDDMSVVSQPNRLTTSTLMKGIVGEENATRSSTSLASTFVAPHSLAKSASTEPVTSTTAATSSATPSPTTTTTTLTTTTPPTTTPTTTTPTTTTSTTPPTTAPTMSTQSTTTSTTTTSTTTAPPTTTPSTATPTTTTPPTTTSTTTTPTTTTSSTTTPTTTTPTTTTPPTTTPPTTTPTTTIASPTTTTIIASTTSISSSKTTTNSTTIASSRRNKPPGADGSAKGNTKILATSGLSAASSTVTTGIRAATNTTSTVNLSKPAAETTSSVESTTTQNSMLTTHPTLPLGMITNPYWLVMTVNSEVGSAMNVSQKARLERELLSAYVHALRIRDRRRVRRTKRYAVESSYSLQIVSCEPLDEKYCDLVFYLTLNLIELDPVSVENIYSRLTTNYLVTHISIVQVHSRIRVYGAQITSMAINLTTAELNNTIDEAVDLGPREETTSFADWMMGAVSLTCFLMAVACFTLKHAVNDKQEAKTWIQRRLSKDVPVKCPMPSAKGNVIPAPTCKDEDADKEDVSCSSFSSKSSETECKRKRSSKKKKKGKTSKSNDESTCGSKSSVECKSEKDEKNYHTKLDKLREMGEIEDDEKCETDDDADDGVAQFAILAQMDKIRNKEKMRRRSRLRKIKLTKAAVKRPLPVLNRNSSCSREESQTKRSPPKKTTRKQRNTSSAGGNGRVRSKCESSVATRASEATNSIARETIHNTARETINSTARETSLLPDVNEASGSSEQKPAARSRSRTKRQKNVTSYSGKSVRFGKNEEQPSKD